MNALDQISAVAITYAGLVTLAALGVTVLRRPRPQWLDSGVWVLEMMMAVRAVAGVGSMLNGQRPDEFTSHVGYLVASV